jgi:hypothetical protein
MSLNFHAQIDGHGDLVGRASATVSLGQDGTLLKADGSPLGTVGFVGRIVQVVVVSNQEIEVGKTEPLLISALDLQGNYLALSPGAIQARITSGSNVLRLNPDGTMTGLANGDASWG